MALLNQSRTFLLPEILGNVDLGLESDTWPPGGFIPFLIEMPRQLYHQCTR